MAASPPRKQHRPPATMLCDPGRPWKGCQAACRRGPAYNRRCGVPSPAARGLAMRFVPACLVVLLAVVAAVPAEAPKLIEAPDDFPTLVNPNCSHCKDEAKRRQAELKDDDRVLCWIRGKYDGGAIPFRFFLNRYRVISDT